MIDNNLPGIPNIFLFETLQCANFEDRQMKLYEAREGYPLSSRQYNDMFDGAIHDIITILSQDIPSLTIDMQEMLVFFTDVEASGLKEFNKDLDFVKEDHTNNWRII